MAGETNSQGMAPKERAAVLAVVSLVVSGVYLWQQHKNISNISSARITCEVLLPAASFIVFGLSSSLHRLVRGLLIAPLLVGLGVATSFYLLGERQWTDVGDFSESFLLVVFFAAWVEFSDPSSKLRAWAYGRGARWFVYYAIYVIELALLFGGLLALSSGVVNLFTPLEWLRDPEFRNQGSLGAIFVGVVFLSAVGLMGGRTRWFVWKKRASPVDTVGGVGLGPRDSFAFLAWSQQVGAGESIEQNQARWTRVAQLIVIVAGGVIGAFAGSGGGMIVGLFIGGWLASLAPRDAVAPDFRLPIQGSAGGAPAAPRPLTEDERRQLVQPVTRREDCEAFVVERDGILYFCIARGDMSKGALPVVEAVPWDSFQNFEEGSHRQWFRSRSLADNMPDWGVIVAQSNIGRVVGVAESVHDHAGLVELLVKLQNTFVVPREPKMRAFRDAAKARARDAEDGSPAGHLAQDVPVKPF